MTIIHRLTHYLNYRLLAGVMGLLLLARATGKLWHTCSIAIYHR